MHARALPTAAIARHVWVACSTPRLPTPATIPMGLSGGGSCWLWKRIVTAPPITMEPCAEAASKRSITTMTHGQHACRAAARLTLR